MTGVERVAAGDVSALRSVEEQLAATLAETAEEFAHVECLDTEQRAEIYAILEMLKVDTDAHRALIDVLKRQLTGKIAHA